MSCDFMVVRVSPRGHLQGDAPRGEARHRGTRRGCAEPWPRDAPKGCAGTEMQTHEETPRGGYARSVLGPRHEPGASARGAMKATTSMSASSGTRMRERRADTRRERESSFSTPPHPSPLSLSQFISLCLSLSLSFLFPLSFSVSVSPSPPSLPPSPPPLSGAGERRDAAVAGPRLDGRDTRLQATRITHRLGYTQQ